MMESLPTKLAELWRDMEEVRERTLDILSGLTGEEFASREGEEWSAAQILAHLLMAETGTSKVIRKAIKTAGTVPPYPAADSDLSARILRTLPAGMKAPEAAEPGTPPGKEELLRQARETRERTAASFAMLASVDPRAATFPHPLFGELNVYEWPAMTILAHERDHQAQLLALRSRLRQGTGKVSGS